MKFLAITHQLTRTGAPVVFFSLIRLLSEDGHDIDVISLEDGSLFSDISNAGFACRVRRSFDESFLEEARAYDYVICNTVETHSAVRILDDSDVSVIWWIHESKEWFLTFGSEYPNPRELHDNIRILSVSPLTLNAYCELYSFETELFPFYVDDLSYESSYPDSDSSGSSELHHKTRKKKNRITRFITIGLFSYMKAPDVLAAAILQLPPAIRSRCEFAYCGDVSGSAPDFVDTVHQITGALPNVRLIESMPHDELMNILSTYDYLIVPSRFDPMPTVAAEAMMLGMPTLVSDGCGIANFMTGTEGYVFPSENVGALAGIIEKAVNTDIDFYDAMCRSARECYENNFTKEIFRKRFYSFTKK